ncbi:hypothetical protein B0A55_13555, partial [Friedmanniomyces simplex]
MSFGRALPEHPPQSMSLRNRYPKLVRSSNLPLPLLPRCLLCSGISFTVKLVDRLFHPNFFRSGAVSSSSSSKKQAGYCTTATCDFVQETAKASPSYSTGERKGGGELVEIETVRESRRPVAKGVELLEERIRRGMRRLERKEVKLSLRLQREFDRLTLRGR